MHVSEAEERLSVPQPHGLIQISSKLVYRPSPPPPVTFTRYSTALAAGTHTNEKIGQRVHRERRCSTAVSWKDETNVIVFSGDCGFHRGGAEGANSESNPQVQGVYIGYLVLF
jgi:hypothetical protein